MALLFFHFISPSCKQVRVRANLVAPRLGAAETNGQSDKQYYDLLNPKYCPSKAGYASLTILVTVQAGQTFLFPRPSLPKRHNINWRYAAFQKLLDV